MPLFIQKDPNIERRRRLAEMLQAQASRYEPVYHPMQGIAKIAQAISGNVINARADQDVENRRREYQDTLANAMKAYREPVTTDEVNLTQSPGGYEAMAQYLMGNPDTAELGLSMIQKRMARQAERKPLKAADNRYRWTDSGEEVFPGIEPAGPEKPASVAEWEFFNGLPPEKQEQYLNMKRANRAYDIGGELVGIGQADKSVTPLVEKTVPPEQQPEFKKEQAAAIAEGKGFEEARQKWQASESKLVSTVDALRDRNEVVGTLIEDAKAKISSWTTSYGANLANWPGTESRALKGLLDGIKANVGFSELQQMRDLSPTGGALGQVSELELTLLNSVFGSLDQAQDAGDLIKTLDRISGQRAAMVDRMNTMYQVDKAKYGTSINLPEKTEPRGISPQELSDEELLRELGM